MPQNISVLGCTEMQYFFSTPASHFIHIRVLTNVLHLIVAPANPEYSSVACNRQRLQRATACRSVRLRLTASLYRSQCQARCRDTIICAAVNMHVCRTWKQEQVQCSCPQDSRSSRNMWCCHRECSNSSRNTLLSCINKVTCLPCLLAAVERHETSSH